MKRLHITKQLTLLTFFFFSFAALSANIIIEKSIRYKGVAAGDNYNIQPLKMKNNFYLIYDRDENQLIKIDENLNFVEKFDSKERISSRPLITTDDLILITTIPSNTLLILDQNLNVVGEMNDTRFDFDSFDRTGMVEINPGVVAIMANSMYTVDYLNQNLIAFMDSGIFVPRPEIHKVDSGLFMGATEDGVGVWDQYLNLIHNIPLYEKNEFVGTLRTKPAKLRDGTWAVGGVYTKTVYRIDPIKGQFLNSIETVGWADNLSQISSGEVAVYSRSGFHIFSETLDKVLAIETAPYESFSQPLEVLKEHILICSNFEGSCSLHDKKGKQLTLTRVSTGSLDGKNSYEWHTQPVLMEPGRVMIVTDDGNITILKVTL